MEWLKDFNRATRINQYADEHKLQVISGYLYGTHAQWFNAIQQGGNPITHWNNENYTSFKLIF